MTESQTARGVEVDLAGEDGAGERVSSDLRNSFIGRVKAMPLKARWAVAAGFAVIVGLAALCVSIGWVPQSAESWSAVAAISSAVIAIFAALVAFFAYRVAGEQLDAAKEATATAKEATATAKEAKAAAKDQAAAATAQVEAAREQVKVAKEQAEVAKQQVAQGKQQVKIAESQEEAARQQLRATAWEMIVQFDATLREYSNEREWVNDQVRRTAQEPNKVAGVDIAGYMGVFERLSELMRREPDFVPEETAHAFYGPRIRTLLKTDRARNILDDKPEGWVLFISLALRLDSYARRNGRNRVIAVVGPGRGPDEAYREKLVGYLHDHAEDGAGHQSR